MACHNGHLSIIKQIYRWYPKINISAKNEYAFRIACENGHLSIIRQLYSWKPTIDISAVENYAFAIDFLNNSSSYQ